VSQSKIQLRSAVDVCLELSADDCPNGPHGPIGKWDVSNLTDTTLFNGEFSKWDVSSVKDMGSMFLAAKSFNRDISKWDVSSVVNMPVMFYMGR
jgi:surface protein